MVCVRLSLFPDGDQELRAVSLLRIAECLELIDRRLVEVHVLMGADCLDRQRR